VRGFSLAVILPLARAYAEHAGVSRSEKELEEALMKDLSDAGALARLLMTSGALFVRAAAPLLFLGKSAGFGGLSPADREELLRRLQNCGFPPVRGLFLGVKPAILALCYPGGKVRG
jgi:hypothetical protein